MPPKIMKPSPERVIFTFDPRSASTMNPGTAAIVPPTFAPAAGEATRTVNIAPETTIAMVATRGENRACSGRELIASQTSERGDASVNGGQGIDEEPTVTGAG